MMRCTEPVSGAIRTMQPLSRRGEPGNVVMTGILLKIYNVEIDNFELLNHSYRYTISSDNGNILAFNFTNLKGDVFFLGKSSTTKSSWSYVFLPAGHGVRVVLEDYGLLLRVGRSIETRAPFCRRGKPGNVVMGGASYSIIFYRIYFKKHSALLPKPTLLR